MRHARSLPLTVALTLGAASVAAQPTRPAVAPHAPASCQYVPPSLAERTDAAFAQARDPSTRTRPSIDADLARMRLAWSFYRAPVVVEGSPHVFAEVIQNCGVTGYAIVPGRWLRGTGPVPIATGALPLRSRSIVPGLAQAPDSAALVTHVNDCYASPAAHLDPRTPWIAAGPAARTEATVVVSAERADEVMQWLRAPRPWTAPLAVDPRVFDSRNPLPAVDESVYVLTATPDVVDVMRSGEVRWARFTVVARRDGTGPHGGGVSWVQCRNTSLSRGYDGLPAEWMFAGAVDEMPVGAQMWGAWIEAADHTNGRWMFVPGSFLREDATHDVGALLTQMRAR